MSRIVALISVLALVGCGGSGSGGGGGGGGDTTPPTATILFPSASALTNAATVTIRGTATDGAGIATLTVNGVAATTTDGFATWTVPNLPLAPGANAVTVDATDGAGNNNPAAATSMVSRDPSALTTGSLGTGPAFIVPTDVLIDEARNRLIVTDHANAASGRVTTVDLATGNRAILSSDAATGGGTPVALSVPSGLAANFSGSALYVTDFNLDVVVLVHLLTGARTVVSDDAVGGPPNFGAAAGVEFNTSNQNVIWAETTNNEILTAAVADGNNRAVLSSNANTGPLLDGPETLRLDVSNNRIFIGQRLVHSILAADLTTGNRVTIASQVMGTGGPTFSRPISLTLDLVGNRLVTYLDGSQALVYVDLATGNRTTISANTGPGVGPDFNSSRGATYDPVKQLGYVFNEQAGAIYLVDAPSGDRVILSK